MKAEKVRPDVSTINLLLSHAHREQLDIKPILDQAKSFDILPDRDTYMICLKVYSSLELVKECVDVLDEMARRSFAFDPDDTAFRLTAEAVRASKNPVSAAEELRNLAKKHALLHIDWNSIGIASK
jgi:pentatricopeptide repeat protein